MSGFGGGGLRRCLLPPKSLRMFTPINEQLTTVCIVAFVAEGNDRPPLIKSLWIIRLNVLTHFRSSEGENSLGAERQDDQTGLRGRTDKLKVLGFISWNKGVEKTPTLLKPTRSLLLFLSLCSRWEKEAAVFSSGISLSLLVTDSDGETVLMFVSDS